MADTAMRKAVKTFLVAIFLASALPVAARATSPFVSIAPPPAVYQFDDLDLRDANNRPIHAPARVNEMRRLFESSLNRLLMENLTPFNHRVQNLLTSTWERWKVLIGAAWPASLQRMLAWFRAEGTGRVQPSASRSWGAIIGALEWTSTGSTSTRFIFLLHDLIETTRLLR